MSYNRQRNDGPYRGGYQYGQQPPLAGGNPNDAGNLLRNLAPEAQVALASTLLTSILQGQQAQQPNVSYGMPGRSSYDPYLEQQQRGYYDNRQGPRNEPAMKQPRFGGDRWDDRNRGRGGNRNVDNFRERREEVRRKDARTKGQRNFNQDRTPEAKKSGNLPKKTPVKKLEKKSEAASDKKPTKDVKKETEEIKTEKMETDKQEETAKPADAVAEELDETPKNEEVKEKEEVKDDEAVKNVADEKEGEEKKQTDEKADTNEEKTVDKDEKKKKERANDKTVYAGIPEEYLYCHICEKQVWDGPSFLRHTRGNKHKSLVNRLEQIYEATIQSMRLLSQLDEQRRTLDIDSKFNYGRQKYRPRKIKCNMCNISFYGSILSHRSNQAHQALKNFLHTKCNVCDEEFRAKIDYDYHLLKSEHIKKVVEKSEGKPVERLKVLSDLMNELQFRPLMRHLRVQGSAEPAQPPPDDEYDIGVIGPYDVHTAIGQSVIRSRNVFFCDICNKFLDRTDDAKQTHLQSEEHIKNIEKKKPKGEQEKDDETKMEVVDEIGETAEGEDIDEEAEDAGNTDVAEEQAAEDDEQGGEEENADEALDETVEEGAEAAPENE